MYEKEIKEKLFKMHKGGMSHTEIGKELGIPISTVSNILSGYRQMKNTSVDLLLKVFPKCRIDLDGNSYVSSADHGGVSVQDISVSGNNNNFFAKEMEKIRRITDAIMASDLSAEAKVKVYGIIKDSEK